MDIDSVILNHRINIYNSQISNQYTPPKDDPFYFYVNI